MSEVVKAEIGKNLAQKFKEKAYRIYGYKKGAISMAVKQLIKRFVMSETADWDKLKGRLKLDKTSVELQHEVWVEKTDSHRHKYIS